MQDVRCRVEGVGCGKQAGYRERLGTVTPPPVCVSERVCARESVCVREREGEKECVCKRENVCVIETESVCPESVVPGATRHRHPPRSGGGASTAQRALPRSAGTRSSDRV